MANQQLRVYAPHAALRCSESESASPDTPEIGIIEKAGYLPIDVQPFPSSTIQKRRQVGERPGDTKKASTDYRASPVVPISLCLFWYRAE